MRTEQLLPILNPESFYNFARLNKEQRRTLLKNEGVFLDHDCDQNTITRLYFLQGFFVEEIVNKQSKVVIELIPYKKGFKLESYLSGNKITNDDLGSESPFECCCN